MHYVYMCAAVRGKLVAYGYDHHHVLLFRKLDLQMATP